MSLASKSKIPTNKCFSIGKYNIVTSTDIVDGGKKADKLPVFPKAKASAKNKGRGNGVGTVEGKGKAKAKAKGRPKAKAKAGEGGGRGLHQDTELEHHGVMIIYHKDLEKHRKYYKQISGNMMQIVFKNTGPDIVINNVYAPQSQIEEEVRSKWFDDFQCF